MHYKGTLNSPEGNILPAEPHSSSTPHNRLDLSSANSHLHVQSQSNVVKLVKFDGLTARGSLAASMWASHQCSVYWKPHVPSVSRCSFHVPHLFELSFPKSSLDPCGLNKRFWCVCIRARTKMSYFIKVCHWFILPSAALLPVHFSSHFPSEGRCLH